MEGFKMDQAFENYVAEALRYEVAMRHADSMFFDLDRLAFKRYAIGRLETAAAAVRAALPPGGVPNLPAVVG